ncbi:unnamed protein product [Toxocara canis]|uniref:Uncharacterized protein n=1 Tax=Toxocara canis TaxID=6265 RepID=A0A183TZ98_TOXCA|nr:unnamed protein product [Toxocara canis]
MDGDKKRNFDWQIKISAPFKRADPSRECGVCPVHYLLICRCWLVQQVCERRCKPGGYFQDQSAFELVHDDLKELAVGAGPNMHRRRESVEARGPLTNDS